MKMTDTQRAALIIVMTALAVSVLTVVPTKPNPRASAKTTGSTKPAPVRRKLAGGGHANHVSHKGKKVGPTAPWRRQAKVVRMRVTAYCPCEKCCGNWSDGITASGVPAEGLIIAAPKTFKFGTQMYIKGYGLATVQDRGGAIKGNRLDVLFPTHQEALEWGVKDIDVIIYPDTVPLESMAYSVPIEPACTSVAPRVIVRDTENEWD